jgi:hypothetical protein
MTTPRNVDQLIKSYLAEGPVELPDRSFEAVRDEIDGTRQRRPIGLPTLPLISDSARLVAVAALLFIAFVGINVLGPGPGISTAPSPSVSPSPSVAPTSSPAPSPSLAPSPSPPPAQESPTTLSPGRYQLTAAFPVAVSVELPNGWGECSIGPLEQGVCSLDDQGGISFMIIDNVVADPCEDKGLDPPVGPTVDDLVAAISALRGFQATSPIDVSVDGHPGKELTVTSPASSPCGLYTWKGPDRTNGVGLGEANRLRIVDVDGTRVLIAAAYHPTASKPDISAELKQVFESVRFP